MASIKISCSGEAILTPPYLPTYLSETYDLKPIVGKPADGDIKAIHAVIRSLNAVAHVPALCNPDLSMQLSQHLFGAQMAIYRANYSMSLLPGEQSVYNPPTLPWHIAGTLNQVVGSPSDEEIKSVQSVVRNAENLATNSQLFDPDLNMKLSQHMFNLQFARYMHDSAQGSFVPEREAEVRSVSQSTERVREDLNNAQGSEPELVPETPPGFARLEEAVKSITGILGESKDVLENMNRVLISTQRASSTMVGTFGNNNGVPHFNPVNQHGVLATECGLPQLRFWMNPSGYRYVLWLNSDEIAAYLGFFDIGSNLTQGGEKPKLINGKIDEATNLLLKHVGIKYS